MPLKFVRFTFFVAIYAKMALCVACCLKILQRVHDCLKFDLLLKVRQECEGGQECISPYFFIVSHFRICLEFDTTQGTICLHYTHQISFRISMKVLQSWNGVFFNWSLNQCFSNFGMPRTGGIFFNVSGTGISTRRWPKADLPLMGIRGCHPEKM